MARYFITAIKDQVFTGENEAYSRGYMAAYRQEGGKRWMPCVNWIADGHGSGHNATIWRETSDQAKAAARDWLLKRPRRR